MKNAALGYGTRGWRQAGLEGLEMGKHRCMYTCTDRRTTPKILPSSNYWISKKSKGSPYSITERRVPELIPVLGSQPAGNVSHKPDGRLPLLSAGLQLPPQHLRGLLLILLLGEEAQWVWAVCLRLLPDSIATGIWTRTFCAWVQHANHSPTEPPVGWAEEQKCL